MKRFIYFVNILLIILIPVVFVMTPVEEKNSEVMSINVAIKQLPSEVLNIEDDQGTQSIDTTTNEDSGEEIVSQISTNVVDDDSDDKGSTSADNTSDESTTHEAKIDILETQVGKMSGYGPDCNGCSGYLASGKYVGDGTIYYDDPTYGSVRILAGDVTYKFGTIIRVNNSNAGSFIGIVLDRGGSIGFGKKYLFDLLYSSQGEAAVDEVSYNVVFEVLRYGY